MCAESYNCWFYFLKKLANMIRLSRIRQFFDQGGDAVMANTHQFATYLNTILDRFDFPAEFDDRLDIFSELFNIPHQKARLILSGSILPKQPILQKIADEFLIELDEYVLQPAS